MYVKDQIQKRVVHNKAILRRLRKHLSHYHVNHIYSSYSGCTAVKKKKKNLMIMQIIMSSEVDLTCKKKKGL